jgi:uncharacterized membrane protein
VDASLIGPDDGFALWAVLLGLAAFGFWCERRPWGRRWSGVMLVIAIAIGLSNVRAIPFASPVYDTVWDTIVPVAIALLLLQADLRRILAEAGPTLVAFGIGAVTVVLGAVIGVAVLPLGPLEPELGGIFAATYIGGSLNFAGTAEATGVRDGEFLAAAVAADNIATNLHFLLVILLPGIAAVTRFFPPLAEGEAAAPEGEDPGRHTLERVDVPGLLLGLAIAFAVAAIAEAVTGALGVPQYAILVVTALAVGIGTAAPARVKRLTGTTEAGNALLLVFLATIGATAEVGRMIEQAPVLFAFAAIIVGVHTIGLLVAGSLLRIGLRELIVASGACIGGPASGAAIASARGWTDLATPGVLAGSLGYAAGTFIGVALAGVLA